MEFNLTVKGKRDVENLKIKINNDIRINFTVNNILDVRETRNDGFKVMDFSLKINSLPISSVLSVLVQPFDSDGIIEVSEARFTFGGCPEKSDYNIALKACKCKSGFYELSQGDLFLGCSPCSYECLECSYESNCTKSVSLQSKFAFYGGGNLLKKPIEFAKNKITI